MMIPSQVILLFGIFAAAAPVFDVVSIKLSPSTIAILATT